MKVSNFFIWFLISFVFVTSLNKITLYINGGGTKYIYASYRDRDAKKPDKIYVDGKQISTSYSDYSQDIESSIGTVELIWNSPLISLDCYFRSCQDIIKIDFSQFDASKVTTMNRIFDSCYSLTSVILSNLYIPLVENIYGMFSYCRSLTSIDLSFLSNNNIKNMEGVFEESTSLKSIDLSNLDFS